MPAHQDLGRLLLLRLRAAGPLRRPRQEHGGDGPGHDRRHLVSAFFEKKCWEMLVLVCFNSGGRSRVGVPSGKFVFFSAGKEECFLSAGFTAWGNEVGRD